MNGLYSISTLHSWAGKAMPLLCQNPDDLLRCGDPIQYLLPALVPKGAVPGGTGGICNCIHISAVTNQGGHLLFNGQYLKQAGAAPVACAPACIATRTPGKYASGSVGFRDAQRPEVGIGRIQRKLL